MTAPQRAVKLTDLDGSEPEAQEQLPVRMQVAFDWVAQRSHQADSGLELLVKALQGPDRDLAAQALIALVELGRINFAVQS